VLGLLVVARVRIRDAERAVRLGEALLRARERDAVLRTPWSREARLHRREVELDDLRVRRRTARLVPEQVLLAICLDERDPLLAASRQLQVDERLLVHREETARRAVLGRHVPERRAI